MENGKQSSHLGWGPEAKNWSNCSIFVHWNHIEAYIESWPLKINSGKEEKKEGIEERKKKIIRKIMFYILILYHKVSCSSELCEKYHLYQYSS